MPFAYDAFALVPGVDFRYASCRRLERMAYRLIVSTHCSPRSRAAIIQLWLKLTSYGGCIHSLGVG